MKRYQEILVTTQFFMVSFVIMFIFVVIPNLLFIAYVVPEVSECLEKKTFLGSTGSEWTVTLIYIYLLCKSWGWIMNLCGKPVMMISNFNQKMLITFTDKFENILCSLKKIKFKNRIHCFYSV